MYFNQSLIVENFKLKREINKIKKEREEKNTYIL